MPKDNIIEFPERWNQPAKQAEEIPSPKDTPKIINKRIEIVTGAMEPFLYTTLLLPYLRRIGKTKFSEIPSGYLENARSRWAGMSTEDLLHSAEISTKEDWEASTLDYIVLSSILKQELGK